MRHRAARPSKTASIFFRPAKRRALRNSGDRAPASRRPERLTQTEGRPLANTTTAEPTRAIHYITGTMAPMALPRCGADRPDEPLDRRSALASIEVDLSPIGSAGRWSSPSAAIRCSCAAPRKRLPRPTPSRSPICRPIARNLPDGAPATAANHIATTGGAGKAEWFVSSGTPSAARRPRSKATSAAGSATATVRVRHRRPRKGPAPQNLEIPVYTFETATKIKVG